MLDRTKAPAIGKFAHLRIPVLRQITLDNGMMLNVINQGEDDIVRLSLIWTRGAAEAQSMQHGLVTSLAMREGTLSHSAKEIAEALDFNGANLRVNIGAHCSRVEVIALSKRLEYVLPTVMEVISRPAFPQHELDIIIENQAQAIEVERHKVGFHTHTAINRMVMGPGNPLATELTPESIRMIRRDDIVETWSQTFVPGRAHAYIAGRIPQETIDLVNATVGAVHPSKPAPHPVYTPFAGSDERYSFIERPGALQSAVRMAIPTIKRDHPDYIPLRLLVTALGGYFGSRLMANIREDKGYTYGIHASLLGYHEGGIMMIGSECDNRYTEDLVEETRNEIARLSTGDFSTDEIERVKSFAMSQLAETLNTPFSIMDYYENMLMAGTPHDYFDLQLKAIQSINADVFARLASEYLSPESLYVAIAGDHGA